jgi:hypothetical protein
MYLVLYSICIHVLRTAAVHAMCLIALANMHVIAACDKRHTCVQRLVHIWRSLIRSTMAVSSCAAMAKLGNPKAAANFSSRRNLSVAVILPGGHHRIVQTRARAADDMMPPAALALVSSSAALLLWVSAEG